MSSNHTTSKSEDIINELKNLVVEVNYTETARANKPKLDKSAIWEKAKKVGKNLTDDSLPTPTPTRS